MLRLVSFLLANYTYVDLLLVHYLWISEMTSSCIRNLD
uniref:Uncharacterized protein n=1 Tax=Lotus japonicus TaxID=34305 RepID=I3S1X4_LOTJA|nr:unknown [Lotus japonicus]